MNRCVPLRPAGVGLALAGLMILCAGRRAEAAPIRPPAPLLAEIRRLTFEDAQPDEAAQEGQDSSRAKAELPLDWSRYLRLKNGRLLLLLQVPDWTGRRSTVALPVTVDRRGRWGWGTPLDGTLAHFGATRDGSIWVASQWETERGEAQIYRSSDGINWKEMGLPHKRVTAEGYAEFLVALCVLGGRVEVQVEGETVNQTWSRGLARKAGGWKLEPQLSIPCAKPRPPVSGCRLDESPNNEVVFHCGGRPIALPKSLKAKRPN